MAVLGASHLAIGVVDMDRALPFYVDVLGFSVTSDFQQEMTPDQAPELHRGRQIRRRQVWLRQSGDPLAMAIALDELSSGDPADRRADIYDIGIHHVGLWVNDVFAIVARARAAGVDVVLPHTAPADAYGDQSGGRIASVFLRDPDGNLIQCDQRIAPGEAADWHVGSNGIVGQG